MTAFQTPTAPSGHPTETLAPPTPAHEPATLEPIVYDKAYNDEGQLIGRSVPKHERRRFFHGSGYPGTTHGPEQGPPPPRPLESLLADLDVHLFLDPQLRARFTDFHAQSPERASRLAAHTLEGAQNGSLARPDAYLASRLRKM